MKLPASRYLLKLLVLCLFLGTFPVMTIGTFSYFRASGTIVDKVNEGNARLLEQTELRVEQILLGIDNAVTQFINTPNVISAMHQELWANEFQQIDDISAGMYRLQSFQYGIQDVYLVNIQHNWLISNRGISRFDEWKSGARWTPFLNRVETSFWLSHRDVGGPLSEGEGGIPPGSVFLMKKLPIHAVSPVGFLLTVIPGYELEKYLLNSSTLGNTTILDSGYRLLVSQSGLESKRELDALVSTLRGQSALSGDFQATIGEERQLVTYRKSPYNGWVYVSVAPLREMMRDSRAIGLFTAFICFIIFILAVTIAYFGSRRMYSPIRSLYEAVTGGGKAPITSDQNEFEQIGERVRSLMQSHTEMSGRLQGQAAQLRVYFVIKLLRGEVKPRELAEQARWFGFPSDWKQMSVIAVDIASLDHSRYGEKDRDLLMFAVSNIAGELFAPAERLDPVLINPFQVTLLATADERPERWKQEAADRAEKLRGTVKDVLGLSISVGVSRPFRRLEEAHQAFQEAEEALRYRIRFEEDAVFVLEQVRPADRKNRSAYPELTGSQLLEAVKLGERGRSEALLKQFMHELLREEISHEEYQLALLRLLMDLLRELQNQGESPQSLWSGETSLFGRFLSLKTAADYERWFAADIIGPMIGLLEDTRSSQLRSISQKVKDIVVDEFATDLTLEQCAARLNYHPSYIRQVFRKETGMNFSDYLAEFRLGMAKKWLLDTDMKIGEIADKLKYNNAQNFIRYFRKMEGMTPGQYREEHRLG